MESGLSESGRLETGPEPVMTDPGLLMPGTTIGLSSCEPLFGAGNDTTCAATKSCDKTQNPSQRVSPNHNLKPLLGCFSVQTFRKLVKI